MTQYEDREFEVKFGGRTFEGFCDIGAEDGGIDADITMVSWYSLSNGKGYYHEFEKNDRNWKRVCKTIEKVKDYIVNRIVYECAEERFNPDNIIIGGV